MAVASFIAGLCMIVVSHATHAYDIRGCVYDDGWPQGQSQDGCEVYDSDSKVDDLVLTVPPGWPPTVLYDVMQYDDSVNPYYRNWVAPDSITIHWRNPCPTNMAEFK